MSEDKYLQPVMYTKDLAPKEMRSLMHLCCMDTECAVSKKCQCLQAGLKCTELCACFGQESCQNDVLNVESESDDSDD